MDHMIHARPDYQLIQDPRHLIPDDEPVFLLRGQDVCAPDVVRFWASCAKRAGADPKIIEAALRQVEAMLDWQSERNFKVPDLPEEGGS